MQKRLYLTAIDEKPGKNFVSVGLLSELLKIQPDLGCYKLFAENDDQQFAILSDMVRKKVAPLMPLTEAMTLLRNQHDGFFSTILDKLDTKTDLLFFEGSDFTGDYSAFEYQFNLTVAKQLNCDVILDISAKDRNNEHIVITIQHALNLAKQHHVQVAGIILNRVPPAQRNDALALLQTHFSAFVPCITVLPEFKMLANPTVGDIAKTLQAQVLYGESESNRIVTEYTVAAKSLSGFLKSRLDREGMLIITPADRIDILLGCLLADKSVNYPEIAGMLLTGGDMPEEIIQNIVSGLDNPFPILLTELKTWETVTTLFATRFSLLDLNKINLATQSMTPYLVDFVMQLMDKNRSSQSFSPAIFLYDITLKARQAQKHIVLPEGQDLRILAAADYILQRKIARITLLGNPQKIALLAREHGFLLPEVAIIDIEKSPKLEAYAKQYFELRKHKNINMHIAMELMLDPNFFGSMMVYCQDADGMVSGADHTTAETIRPALEIIKTMPGVNKVSSVFIMCLASRVLIYGDCAINPDPDSQVLAEIAMQAAGIAKSLGLHPKVALLSYSSGTSGKGESVEKVADAYAQIMLKSPDFLVEGPIQYDAAVDPVVAQKKLPDSILAGQANVLIFPDLNTGNNTYKAVQRETGALAIGPVLLGLNKPVNDLSRGCTPQDVINTIIITAIQAQP